MVRLRSAKCTVGSGPRCTLRLRARGVAPLHCLIVRGPAAAAVQCWAADTRLNHRAFRDAPLVPGDRLSIGPIELEVVLLGGTGALHEPSADENQPQNVPADELTELQRETQATFELERERLDAEREQLDARLTDVETRERALADERQQWETMREEASRRSSAETEQTSARLSEIEEQCRKLEEERQQWQSEHDAMEHRVAEERDNLAAAQAASQAEQDAFAAERRQWQAEQQQSARDLVQEREQLDARLTDVETRERALADERQQWETMREEASRRSSAETEQTSARLSEIEEQCRKLEEERQQWQSEHDAMEHRVAEERDNLAAAQAASQAEQDAFAAERQQWQAERDGATAAAEADGQHLGARLEDLQSQRHDLDEQRRQWEEEHETAKQEFAGRANDLEAQRNAFEAQRAALSAEQEVFHRDRAEALADLEDQRAALETERREWDANRAQAAAAARERPDPPVGEENETVPVDAVEAPAPAEPTFETPAERPPVDLSEVLRRFGADVELENDEPKGVAPSRAVECADDRPAAPAATKSASHPVAEDEEESIDEYMSRLMQRVRPTGSGAGTPAYVPNERSEPAPVAASQALPLVPASPPPSIATSAEQKYEPVEMLPRAVAPERRADLSMLREVANLSAQTALSQHSRRLLVDTMYSKLATAGVALASSIALFWLCRYRRGFELTFYSALIGVLVAFYWGLQYALLSGRLIVSKGHLSIGGNAFGQGGKAESPHSDAAVPHTEPAHVEVAGPSADAVLVGQASDA